MKTMCEIVDGTVRSRITVPDDQPFSTTKLAADGGPMFRPLVEEPMPVYNALTQSLSESTETIEVSRVIRRRTVQPLAPSVIIAGIKAEAARRILARYPDYKQANMLARQGELHRIQTGHMMDAAGQMIPARALNAAETAELSMIGAAWAWIKSVRATSNTLETATPIPSDYTSDSHWPA